MNSGFDSSSPDPQPLESDEPEIPDASSPQPRSRQSRMIAPILSGAVRLWLRSQLERVEELQVKIEGGDRQFLSGCVQQVTLAAQKAVYQGLHLSQVNLVGYKIRVNLGQVLRGLPLRLLEPIPVKGDMRLYVADLNASLQAPLLANAVSEFLGTLLRSNTGMIEDLADSDQPIELQNLQAAIDPGQLVLGGTLLSASGSPIPVFIRTGLQVENGRELRLVRPEWLTSFTARRGLLLKELDGFTIDLGAETCLHELTLEAGQLVCRGEITVIPA